MPNAYKFCLWKSFHIFYVVSLFETRINFSSTFPAFFSAKRKKNFGEENFISYFNAKFAFRKFLCELRTSDVVKWEEKRAPLVNLSSFSLC